ncbi:MAG: hypothetical protein AB8E87_10635 [Prochlorococcus sp.]
MLKLEQITALLVAGGLAIASYLLFFSWSGGGGYEHRGIDQAPDARSEHHADGMIRSKAHHVP